MPKIAKKKGFVLFFEKKCSKNLPVSKMAVILQRFSTEISSSGLGRRPLTAETRVRVPVSLPAKPSPFHERGLYFSTEISSSGLGRRPLTAETRVRVPVSLPSKAFSIRAGGFLVYGLGKCLCRPSRPRSQVPHGRFPVPRPPFSGSPWPVPCAAPPVLRLLMAGSLCRVPVLRFSMAGSLCRNFVAATLGHAFLQM